MLCMWRWTKKQDSKNKMKI